MNWLDIVILVALVVPALVGLRRGLIKSALLLAGLIIGVILAGNFYQPLSGLLTFIPNENAANIAAFILIVVVVTTKIAVLALLIKSATRKGILGWMDHVGGAVFGFLLGATLWSSLLATWITFFGSGLVTESLLALLLLDKFPLVLGLLPSEFDAIRSFFQ
jgi:membrane protein required for colicin V production|tara:strand:+ start:422 stop:907 length:486 start_codon:yes stop_codon:yes gene_type:complete